MSNGLSKRDESFKIIGQPNRSCKAEMTLNIELLLIAINFPLSDTLK